MLILKRLPQRQSRHLFVRGNATTQPADSASSHLPPTPAQTKKSVSKATEATDATSEASQDVKKKRSPQWSPVRPSISLERPRQYMRPVGRHVLPVYDLAVGYIQQDSQNLKRELAEVKAELVKGGRSATEVERLQERVNILEVQSEINLPSVRWKARNGLGM